MCQCHDSAHGAASTGAANTERSSLERSHQHVARQPFSKAVTAAPFSPRRCKNHRIMTSFCVLPYKHLAENRCRVGSGFISNFSHPSGCCSPSSCVAVWGSPGPGVGQGAEPRASWVCKGRVMGGLRTGALSSAPPGPNQIPVAVGGAAGSFHSYCLGDKALLGGIIFCKINSLVVLF